MLKRFSQVSNTDVLTCWWKGASLGEMIQAGFPVPGGFVLTTKAFWTDPHQWDNEVLHAFDQLNCKFVAVRSSGTKEDGSDDSFAGQFDTYLFVSKEKLIEQIIECHNSVKSDRILAYCASKNINPDDIKVAVVVQKMVNSDVAGVCFTANPITGNREEIMIEAWFGVGEAVVSGMITPDNYVVKKITESRSSAWLRCTAGDFEKLQKISRDKAWPCPNNGTNQIKKQISNQNKKIVLNLEKGGTREEEIETTIVGVQKLSDEHILELAKYAERIEKHYGKPMDIERAVEDGELFILQARPITTLENKEKAENNDIYINDFIAKIKNVDRDVQRFNAYPFFISSVATVSGFDLPWGLSYTHFFCISHAENVQWHYDNADYTRLWNLFREKIQTSDDFFQLIDEQEQRYTQAKSEYDRLLKSTKIFSFKTVKPLLKAIVNELAMACGYAHIVEGARAVGEKLLYEQQGVNTILPREKSFLLKAQEKAISLKQKYPIEKAYQLFMQNYAWIKNSYLWITRISLQDFIEFAEHTPESFELPNYEKNSLLEKLSLLFSWQDTRKAHILQSIHRADTLLQTIASTLNIDRTSLYFILPEEVEKIDDKQYRQELLERTHILIDYASNVGTRLTLTGQEAYDFQTERERKEISHEQEMRGNTGYAGKVKGKVRICLTMESIKAFQEGEILVASMTRPEYVGAIKKSAGIITDEWGITCHAAIVAREMKKPCIIGTKIATQVLKDGDLVEVDADNGVVKILESVGSITTLEKGNHEDLYDQFMKSLQGDTSFSFFARCSILCIGSVPWLKNKYSPQQKKQGFLLLLVDKDLVMEVANSDLHDSYAVNTFKDFLSGKTNIQCLKREFTETCKKIDHLYAQEILDPQKLINECAELMMQLCAKTLYIENFSKRIAEEGLQIKIADDIWEHATSPSFEHFETRWLKAVKKSKTPEEVDYVFQDYYFLPTDEDLRILWETKKKEKIKNKADSKPVLSKLEPWVEFTQFVMMLRDLRKDPYAKIQSLICKSARLLYPDVPDELLAHINLFEVADNTLPSVEVLKKRNTTPYVLLLKEDTGFSYDYDAYDRIKALVEKIDENQDTVYGDTASRGKYKGIVRIVRNPEDDFNKGDILCTWMTRPEFVSLMKKAGAIITNEGGITCHAAIVSRELKIPCIIWTRNATQVLKDGDLVEVDADHGVVRILKKVG